MVNPIFKKTIQTYTKCQMNYTFKFKNDEMKKLK